MKKSRCNESTRVNVFLAWSGERSRKTAELFRDYLPLLINSVTPFMSDEDILKGSPWLNSLMGKLESTRIGILCLTPENLRSPWIHFEAGALSKVTDRLYVCPFLLGAQIRELETPLSIFQATVFEKKDMRRMIRTINTGCAEAKPGCENPNIDKAFDCYWSVLNTQLKRILASMPKTAGQNRELPQIKKVYM